jgi:FkbM family methyltransferase
MNIDTYLAQSMPQEAILQTLYAPEDKLVIFDVGSCEGEDSVRYQRLFPKARIFAFEPLSGNVQKMKQNFLTYQTPDVTIIQKGLSEHSGKATFFVSSGRPEHAADTKDWDYGNKSSSLLPPDKTKEVHEWLKFRDKITISTTTIAEISQAHKLKRIDFIHMDIQGAELMALKGAGKTIASVRAIWLEVEAESLYANQPLKAEIEQFFADHKFIKVMDTVDAVAGDQFYINSRAFDDKMIRQARQAGRKWFLQNRLRQTAQTYLKQPALRIKAKVGKEVKSLRTPNQKFMKTSYSQCGEDLIMKHLFGPLGIQHPTYMDIGAHHPFFLNNTALFYRHGGRGINIEPDPGLFSAFQKYRKADINLNIGVAPGKPSEMNFYQMSEPVLNTFSKKEAQSYRDSHGHSIRSVIKIPVLPINKVCEEYLDNRVLDILSIDVEGLDFQILKSLNFKKYPPSIICIETISYSETGNGVKNEEIISYLKQKGYMLFADTYINSIFVRQDLWVR